MLKKAEVTFMIQLEPLWKYQKADLALFRFERGLKKSETRNKLHCRFETESWSSRTASNAWSSS